LVIDTRLTILEVLRDVAGKDATKQFKKYHDSRILDRISTQKLIVGALDTSADTPTKQKQSFFSKLKTLVSGKHRVDAVPAGQLKVIEPVVEVSKQREEAATSNVEGENARSERAANIVETYAIVSPQQLEATTTKDEVVKEDSAEKN
jgi:hypothetical protein